MNIRAVWILVFCLGSVFAQGATDSMSLGDYLRAAQKSGKLQQALGFLDSQVVEKVPDEWKPPLRETLGMFMKGDFSAVDRFPTLPDSSVLAQGIEASGVVFGAMGSSPSTQESRPYSGELTQLMIHSDCKPNYGEPVPLSEHLPGIGYGHFADRGMDPCLYINSETFAAVLTALSRGDGSFVDYQGVRHETPQGLVEALLKSGHQITVKDERMYADFLSLAVLQGPEKSYIRIPVWMDTGLKLEGEKVLVPVGHSHHIWEVSGPVVSVRVKFYLGMYGVGFFADNSRRPLWTGRGYRMKRTAKGMDENGRYMVETFRGASLYFQKMMEESKTVAKDYPADGYGYLGVCNDTNAFMMLWTSKFFPVPRHWFPFPLLRNEKLDAEPSNEVGSVLARAPHDGSDDRKTDLLSCRVLGSYPHPTTGNGFDTQLNEQMKGLKRQLRHRGIRANRCGLLFE